MREGGREGEREWVRGGGASVLPTCVRGVGGGVGGVFEGMMENERCSMGDGGCVWSRVDRGCVIRGML